LEKSFQISTMNSRKRLALIIAILVLAVGFVVLLRRDEPSYKGKRLSQWIRGLEYENVNPTDDQRAALFAMGEPAIKKLIVLLEKRDSALKQKLSLMRRTMQSFTID